uniref:C-type lectin domain-containing protein n=1 Tax=Strigops habroptila TaxID=2489341 RepID=A0A672U1G4_STRHB
GGDGAEEEQWSQPGNDLSLPAVNQTKGKCCFSLCPGIKIPKVMDFLPNILTINDSSLPQARTRCLENGIGYREKCFYFVEDEAEWNRSETFCRSLGAHLATIDTWQELRFLLRYGGSLHYWIGLRREGSAPWTWFNGSLFNNSFQIRGRGQCAFVNGDGISSDWCSLMKYSVCSHPQTRPTGSRRDPEVWNLT